MLAWLSVWSEVQTCIWPSWCHCHSSSLASVKSRLVLPFWYRLTRVVPDKGPLNGVCVCVCHSHCGYHTSLIDFLLVLWSMASALHSCWAWQCFTITSFQVFLGLPLHLIPSFDKWGLAQTPSCDCGQRQTVNHTVNTYPLTKLEGGLNLLHTVVCLESTSTAALAKNNK